MQPVNVLPAFVSQEADSKAKDSSGSSAESHNDTDFSSLVEQHLPQENKTTSRNKSSVVEQDDTAIEGKTIAANGKNGVDESKGRGAQESPDNNTTKKHEANAPIEEEDNNDALTESEQFISLLYNSDQTLSQSKEIAKQGKNKAIVDSTLTQTNENDSKADTVKSKNNQSELVSSDVVDQDSSHLEAAHKLKAFSKDELLARAQMANSSDAASKSGDQTLKDYQQSLQSQQSRITSQSITSEQLMNVQLASAQLKNNKVTDLASGISQASRNNLTEKVDSGLYQLPVEPIGKGSVDTEQVSTSPEVSSVKEKINEVDNKIHALSKPQGVLSTELVTEEADLQSIKKANSLLEASDVKANNTDTATSKLSKANLDKLIADGNTQTPEILKNTAKEQVVDTQVKQPVMTNEQLQALQQAQAQQKIQSVNSEQQVVDNQVKQPVMTSAQILAVQQAQAQQKSQAINNEQKADDSASDEYIDSMLPAGEKTVEVGVKSARKVVDNITMRSMSDIQVQAVQATQAKQNNDAYLEHQVSEVLNHNVASDTAQIQKNNVQLQQETVSIFRKDFAEAVKDKVMITINQKLQQFDIKLDPPEFGNMQVRVNLQGEQASVNFVVQNQQAKDALEQNMHKLREMLSEQGVDVGGSNVEQQNQEQSSGDQGLSKNNDNGTVLADGTKTEEANVEHVLSAQLFDSSATSVDYYA
jgi:flagellar hook-length control protein FliK